MWNLIQAANFHMVSDITIDGYFSGNQQDWEFFFSQDDDEIMSMQTIKGLRIKSCDHHITNHICEDSNFVIPLLKYLGEIEDLHLPVEMIKENENLKKLYFQIKHQI